MFTKTISMFWFITIGLWTNIFVLDSVSAHKIRPGVTSASFHHSVANMPTKHAASCICSANSSQNTNFGCTNQTLHYCTQPLSIVMYFWSFHKPKNDSRLNIARTRNQNILPFPNCAWPPYNVFDLIVRARIWDVTTSVVGSTHNCCLSITSCTVW